MFFVLCMLFLLAMVPISVSLRDEDGGYHALCEISSLQLSSSVVEPCVVALFHASESFQLNYHLYFDAIGEYCAEQEESMDLLSTDSVILALRGKCPFDAKVRNIEGIPFSKGVLLVDPNAVNLTETPLIAPGSADPAYQSNIPCVLLGRHLYDTALLLQTYNRHFDQAVLDAANVSLADEYLAPQKIELSVRVHFEVKKKSKSILPDHIDTRAADYLLVDSSIGSWGRAGVYCTAAIVFVLFVAATCNPDATLHSLLFPAAITTVLLATALLLRCGTFRLSAPERLKDLEFMLKMRPNQIVPGKMLAPYAHSETDELVYEVLVQSVLQSPFDYSLYDKMDIIQSLNLSFDHYHMKIFIHPPNFIYFCAFCSRYLGLHLMSVPLLCQGITLLCVGFIAQIAQHSARHAVGSETACSFHLPWNCSLWSMLIYAVCPLSVFIAQKLWIDNMLCMTVAIAVGLHLFWSVCGATGAADTAKEDPSLMRRAGILRSSPSPGVFALVSYVLKCIETLWRSTGLFCIAFGSSLFYSLIACNTKITALSVLPCLGIFSSLLLTRSVLEVCFHHLVLPLPGAVKEKWSIITRGRIPVRTKPKGDVRGTENEESLGSLGGAGVGIANVPICGIVVWSLLLCTAIMTLVFIAGFLVGHGPWMLLYKTRTGRWLPNAWPSGEMLRNSPYMQKVIGRPWYYYLRLLCEITPIHLMGLLYGLLKCGHWLKTLTLELSCGGKNGVLKDRLERVLALFSNDMCITILLTLWSVSVLVGHNVLGVLGAGYQTRFIAPLVTPCCVLAATAVATPVVSRQPPTKSGGATVVIVQESRFALMGALLLAYSTMGTLFYGVLFAPIFADFDFSIGEIIFGIITANPAHNLANADRLKDVIDFMKHYGLKMD